MVKESDHDSFVSKIKVENSWIRLPQESGHGMKESRQRFWELTGSKLGDILGVEKTKEQIDADTAVVGEEGEVDFKKDARFAQHLKKGNAVSEFAKPKPLTQQRQYLPIFSVRDNLLQVVRENQVVEKLVLERQHS